MTRIVPNQQFVDMTVDSDVTILPSRSKDVSILSTFPAYIMCCSVTCISHKLADGVL